MSSIRVELNGDEQALLDRLSSLSEADTAAAMAAIGEALRTSTLERFDTGTDPEGRRWRTSIRAEASGGKTLVKSGQLKSSIHTESSDKGVAVGTNKIYAATHQLGARNRTIRAKEGGLLRFKIGDRWISKKEVRVDIPARPFLGVSEEDMQEISHIIENAVTGG